MYLSLFVGADRNVMGTEGENDGNDQLRNG